MNSGPPTEFTIRQYLLGRLDDQKELESSLSRQMLFDRDLSELVDAIEDEIIDSYLDGALSTDDKQAVEEYFLRPPQRQEKLRFARSLRKHFESKKHSESRTQAAIVPPVAIETGGAVAIHWRSHYRAYYEIAALMLLVFAGTIYLARVRHEIDSQTEASRKALQQLEGELAKERGHSASLAKQLETYQPTVAMLAFLGPVFRDHRLMPELEIKPYTERIRVEIDLQGASAHSYNVRLENQAREQVWSQTGLEPAANGLKFYLPAQPVTTGEYCFVIDQQGQAYCFRAKANR